MKNSNNSKSDFQKAVNKRFYIYISFILLLSIFAMTSLSLNTYALWFETNNQPSNNLISTGCFEISYSDLNENGKSTSISLLNSYPISEERGVKLNPYIFKLKNICTSAAEYRIVLSKLDNSTLDNQYLRYTFNQEGRAVVVNPFPQDSNTVIDSATEAIINHKNKPKSIINNYVLEEGTLKPNEERSYNLRIWLDETAGNDQMEKEFEGVVSVSSISVNK